MNELFRGYVKTRNKKCTQKFAKGEQLLTKEQADQLDEYAGILAKETVLIDIDDAQQAECLMNIVEAEQLNCLVLDTTRGKHFYFKNTNIAKCYTATKTACGLTVDIKVGTKNTYAILKFKGEERFTEWDKEPSAEYDQLPKWLMPVEMKSDLFGMTEGDGRNQAMFNHILILDSYGFTKEQSVECLNIINEFVFKKPLPKSEIKTILRDESFPKKAAEPKSEQTDDKKFFSSKGGFLFDKFSQYLMEQYRIVKINKQLHIYKDGVYVLGDNYIEAKMIKHISNLNQQKRKEVLSYLNLLIKDNALPSDANFIAFKNGIFNLDTKTLELFTPDVVITNKINYNYNPNAYSEVADNALDKLACKDPNIRALLEEVIGYCFYRRNELRKAFILTGEKNNGKSTYLDMISQLLGNENTTALDLGELGDRFKTAELFGKLANIGDDIGDEFIANPAIFKKVVSGDRVNAERKGKDPFDFACYAKQLFSANSIPRIKDKSGAVIDRLIIVPFDAEFTKDDPDYDPYIKYKLRADDVMEYLILLGLNGLERVLKMQGFTTSDKVIKNIKEYEETNNPILMFFREIDETQVLEKQTKFVYQKYAEFCIGNNYQQLSNIEFSKQIRKFYNCDVKVKSIDGKSVRIFTKN